MDKDTKPWRTVSSRVVYENSWLKVREDKTQMPNGKEGIYGFIQGGSGVYIIAVNNEEEIYLVESYRYPTQRWHWELPTGGLSANAKPLEAAKDELSEELGVTAKKWTSLSSYTPSHNGFMKDTQFVFVAEDLKQGTRRLGDFESIRATKTVSLEELMAAIRNGEFADGQSLAALMQFIAWKNG